MKFELKTESDFFSKSFSSVFFTFISILFIAMLYGTSIKLGNISKHYEINYLCRLLLVEKSSFDFKNLIKLTKETNKQKIWDLCQQIVK